jgi:dihydrodipicolinate synthase/N-acetylneuraminate lyase
LETRPLQAKINELIRITLKFPAFQAMKLMLTLEGIDCGPCLPPRRALTEEEKRALQAALARSSFEQHAFALTVGK